MPWPRPSRTWLLGPVVLGSVIALAVLLSLESTSRPVQAEKALPEHAAHHPPMTDEDMRRWVDDWYRKHPIVGRSSSTATVADTFFVSNNRFNADGNLATPIDTAKILVGDAVLWRWLQGIHTITNGSGAADPQAGSLFDVPIDGTPAVFQFTFGAAGTYLFFCRPHEGFNMRGVVVVRNPVDVGPSPGPTTLGFTADPWPNPTSATASFGFALPSAGRARAEVFDARGRRVAVIVDRVLDAGTHPAAWDGKNSAGMRAASGVYYLRLRLRGHDESRRIVIAR